MSDTELSKLSIPPHQRAVKDLKEHKKRRVLIMAVLLLAVTALAIYRYRFYAVPVTVKPLEIREIGLPPVTLTAGGYIVADPQVTVSSKISGQITRLPVKEGDEIKTGALLAVIGAEDIAAQHESSRRAHEIALRHYERIQALYAADAAAKRELDIAEADAKNAEAQFKTAKFNYEQSRVVSPIDGSVIRILRKEGEYLSPGLSAEGEPGTSILTLGNLKQMKVELDINENDIAKLRIGQPALVFPDAIPETVLDGRVSEISPMADRQKSIIPIKVALETANPAVKPEMSARVTFLEKEMSGTIERALLVPADAVRYHRGSPHVFILDNERAREKPVELGEKIDDAYRVKSGLSSGDTVVVDPPFVLRDGRRVEIKSE